MSEVNRVAYNMQRVINNPIVQVVGCFYASALLVAAVQDDKTAEVSRVMELAVKECIKAVWLCYGNSLEDFSEEAYGNRYANDPEARKTALACVTAEASKSSAFRATMGALFHMTGSKCDLSNAAPEWSCPSRP